MTLQDPPALDAFDDLERQYNPRVTVPEAAAIVADWLQRGVAARAALPPRLLAYGADPRETIELYRAPAARGALAFVHGGYWRSLTSGHFSWMAAPWVAAGVSVALIEYPLCPQVEVRDIVACVRRALPALAAELGPAARRLALAGHSAGGYLVAAMLADPPQPPVDLAGVLALSGVFDPGPLRGTSINADIRLTPEAACDLNLLARRPAVRVPLTLAVGAQEPEAFHRQSAALARAWPALAAECILEGANHFDIVEALARRDSAVGRRVESWLAAQA